MHSGEEMSFTSKEPKAGRGWDGFHLALFMSQDRTGQVREEPACEEEEGVHLSG